MDRTTIFCSVVIPTIGRPSLKRAIESVLAQKFAQQAFEVVVVNDSGNLLAPEEWQQSPQVKVIHTQKRRNLVARNAGAAVASGRYLLFLDDDDWLCPGALSYYWTMAQQNPLAGCLFGSFELVDDNGNVMSRHGLQPGASFVVQLVSGYWMQLAAVLIRTDAFFAIGGFSPLMRISDEIDLFNRLAMSVDFVGQNVLVAQIYRGQGWKTSVNYSNVHEFSRWARDRALNFPHAFERLRQSAGASSYWNGRILRLYVVSMLWNWRRKRRFFAGASRAAFALRSMISAWPHLASKNYWRAVRQDAPDQYAD